MTEEDTEAIYCQVKQTVLVAFTDSDGYPGFVGERGVGRDKLC